MGSVGHSASPPGSVFPGRPDPAIGGQTRRSGSYSRFANRRSMDGLRPDSRPHTVRLDPPPQVIDSCSHDRRIGLLDPQSIRPCTRRQGSGVPGRSLFRGTRGNANQFDRRPLLIVRACLRECQISSADRDHQAAIRTRPKVGDIRSPVGPEPAFPTAVDGGDSMRASRQFVV